MDALKSILSTLSKYKIVAFAAIVLLALFIAVSAVRCTAVHAPEPAEELAQEQAEEEQAGPSLDERQQQFVDAYEKDELDLKAILEANVWTGAGENSTLKFADNVFTESSTDGTSNSSAYAIEALKRSASGDGSTETTTAALLVNGETHIVTLLKVEDEKDGSLAMSLSGDCFVYSGAYTRTDAAVELDVEKVDEGFDSLIGGKGDEVREAVSDWAAQYCPTATHAEWSGMATADWDGLTVSTSFTFDNQSKTQVTVTYSMADGTVTAGDVK